MVILPARRCPPAPRPAWTRRTLAQLAAAPPGPLPLVPPANTAEPRICPGQLAIGGCRTNDTGFDESLVAEAEFGAPYEHRELLENNRSVRYTILGISDVG